MVVLAYAGIEADRIVCRCVRVTESAVLSALENPKVRTVYDIRKKTGAGAGCFACQRRLRAYLAARDA